MNDNAKVHVTPEEIEITWDDTPQIPPTQAKQEPIVQDMLVAKAAPAKPVESQGNDAGGACSKPDDLKLREAWLMEAFKRMTGQDHISISCGFGKGGNRSKKSFAVHYDEHDCSQIYISPLIDSKDEALKSVGDAANAVGYKVGPDLESVSQAMPPYPQCKLADKKEEKKDGIRQLKVMCPVCGYTCRTSRKWLDEAGEPYCPVVHGLPAERLAANIAEVIIISGDEKTSYRVLNRMIEQNKDSNE